MVILFNFFIHSLQLTRYTLFPYTTLFRSIQNILTSIFHLSRLSTSFHYWIHLLLSIILRSEEHTSELQSRFDLVCCLLLEKKNYIQITVKDKNIVHV